MNQLENKNLKELLDEFLEVHYSGSFSRMISEYIRITGMTEEEVDALLEEIKHLSV
jgi:histidinol-phosphate/aromatic aminotransferase/cobyric acid decarboxylase-like protein